MSQLVAIDNKIHHSLKLNSKNAELHGAELNLIPVVVSEFVNLAVQYPIVLTKNGDTGQFVFAAMLGFTAKENLFWHDGSWQGLYLPLQIQRQPFFVGNNDVKSNADNCNEYIVCIDLASPMIVNDAVKNSKVHSQPFEALFDATGEETPYFQHAKNCLGQLLQGEIDNEKLINALQNLDLIQSLALEITFGDGSHHRLNGLYTINQEKLAALSSAQVSELHQAGFLQAIYTMISSLGQIYALIDKKNKTLGCSE